MKEDVEGWIASQATDRLAGYAARGRKHQNLSDDDLTKAWVDAFRSMAGDPSDSDRRTIEDDFKFEFSLRGESPPYDAIREEFERYVASVDRYLEKLKVEDPLLVEEIGREIEAELKAFKSERDRNQN